MGTEARRRPPPYAHKVPPLTHSNNRVFVHPFEAMGGEDADGGDGDQTGGWAALGLDPRLLRALTKKQYRSPTAVQARAIPLVLEGKDVVARAHTGSGKTAAYLLPAIHKMMQGGDGGAGGAAHANPRALILVPTRELAHQVKKEAAFILAKCAPSLRAGELPASGCAAGVLREFAGAPPEVLVATPARAAECIRGGLFPPGALASGLELLVLDEADLLLSFGYEDDIRCVAGAVQRGCQCMLLSATSSKELTELQALVLHRPVYLDVGAGDGGGAGGAAGEGAAAVTGEAGKAKAGPAISHFTLEVAAKDKLLYCMALLRLGLCKRKSLIFVANPDAAVRLRLFLHKFGIPCCALHAELPANSRAHILQEFNRGIYDYMIAAADDAAAEGGEGGAAATSGGGGEDENDDDDEGGEKDGADGKKGTPKKGPKQKGGKGGSKKRDKEFGVVRGIDFKDVQTVINFDVPPTAAAYVHRVGRTGRAGKAGTAITLVSPAEEAALEAIRVNLAERGGTAGATAADELKPFDKLSEEAVEALRYRAEDAARAVGRSAVREARVRELRSELLNSERLAAHFEDNPEDLNLLKHDVSLAKHPAAPHLSHLPGYLRGRKRTTGAGGAAAEGPEDAAGASAAAGAGSGGAGRGGSKGGVVDEPTYADVEEASEFGQKKRRRRAAPGRAAGKGGEDGNTKGALRPSDIFKKNKKKPGRHRAR